MGQTRSKMVLGPDRGDEAPVRPKDLRCIGRAGGGGPEGAVLTRMRKEIRSAIWGCHTRVEVFPHGAVEERMLHYLLGSMAAKANVRVRE